MDYGFFFFSLLYNQGIHVGTQLFSGNWICEKLGSVLWWNHLGGVLIHVCEILMLLLFGTIINQENESEIDTIRICAVSCLLIIFSSSLTTDHTDNFITNHICQNIIEIDVCAILRHHLALLCL